ncbi:MAG TPA: POTRA domain-containing protein [Terriglobales bacterium]|nr:POTRA domain-containing protein [Terriglobales bacterium]
MTRKSAGLLYNSPVSCRGFGFLLPILLLAAAAAQTGNKAQPTYKLISVHVKGLTHLPEDKVVAASGLKPGQLASETNFQQAAQKLGQTGLFTDLTYKYQYANGGCELELQATESEKLVPVMFDNLVWFSDSELLNLIHARVPLFDGKVPEAGNMADQVAEALTAILSEKKIAGEIVHFPFAPEDSPIQAYVYKISFHPVTVRNIEFPGAAPDEIPALQTAAKSLIGQDYLQSKMRVQERLNLLPVYQARGYLKAQFADAKPKVAQDGAETLVDVSFPVSRGIQYKLKDLEFAGDKSIPVEDLRSQVHLKVGEPANAVQLNDDLDLIHKLYGTKGFLFARVSATPAIDDSDATVAYQLTVNEGEMYRMGELSIDGLPDDNAHKMVAQWQMKKGDPYDDSYAEKFFGLLYRDYNLHKSYEVERSKAINREEKTVSVSLHFIPKS